MGWQEQIDSDFVITTGDGKVFIPEWMNATKGNDFQIAEFDFPDQPGTLVRRSQPKGRRFNIEIFFQGDDNLDKARDFEISARDPRAWTILHPLYGTLIVQPLGLGFDDTKHNVTKIISTVIETIVEDNPQATIDPIDKINADKEELDVVVEESFATDVIPSTTDITTMTTSSNTLFQAGKVLAGDAAEEYFNLFNDANSAILDATAEPLLAIRSMNALISAPGLFNTSVKSRIALLTDQFNRLSVSIGTIIEASKKKIYESNAGVIISTMALTVANPIEGDFANRPEVISRIDEILAVYNAYIVNLDQLQTDDGGNPDSFIPDHTSLIGLEDIINFAVSNLFDIALNTSQERIIIVEKDSNVILLTHRIYGLDPDDSFIDQLIDNNNIGINELIQIKKNRRIKYYI